jgi:hypothetical protein
MYIYVFGHIYSKIPPGQDRSCNSALPWLLCESRSPI